MNKFSIAIHGGAGTLVKGMMTPEKETAYKQALQKALDAGYAILKKGGTAVNAVEIAVKALEDSHLFNAGKGAVFTATETHEMDASIMDGKNLEAGAVSLISGIKNPISLARDVMEKSEHVFLAGEGAMQFAKANNYTLEKPEYFYDELRHQQWLDIKDTDGFQLDHTSTPLSNPTSVLRQAQHTTPLSNPTSTPLSNQKKDSKFGTVGAVACDKNGNIAAATSTGGMTNKRYGRVGDSPMIGAGNYANNKTCAVSCTGSGEFFIRGVVAYDVSCLMEYKGLSLKEASEEVINKRILEIGGDGGLIAVDALGNIAMPFNTEGMYRGTKTSEGEDLVLIYR